MLETSGVRRGLFVSLNSRKLFGVTLPDASLFRRELPPPIGCRGREVLVYIQQAQGAHSSGEEILVTSTLSRSKKLRLRLPPVAGLFLI
jgi:hypothetical protein